MMVVEHLGCMIYLIIIPISSPRSKWFWFPSNDCIMQQLVVEAYYCFGSIRKNQKGKNNSNLNNKKLIFLSVDFFSWEKKKKKGTQPRTTPSLPRTASQNSAKLFCWKRNQTKLWEVSKRVQKGTAQVYYWSKFVFHKGIKIEQASKEKKCREELQHAKETSRAPDEFRCSPNSSLTTTKHRN